MRALLCSIGCVDYDFPCDIHNRSTGPPTCCSAVTFTRFTTRTVGCAEKDCRRRRYASEFRGKAPGGNSNSTETIIPRERLDTQTPEVAEVVSYAMTFINKQVEPKRLARVINIVNAFREKRTATDATGYYTATLQLRRANGRIEFQDIKVGRNLESGSLASCTHKLRSSAFSMRTRNFGELVSVKPVGGNKNS